MHRLTVLYPAKGGEAFDYDYYFDDHHKLGARGYAGRGELRIRQTSV
jgi:hypothetical protein